jgi:hypothetical protein
MTLVGRASEVAKNHSYQSQVAVLPNWLRTDFFRKQFSMSGFVRRFDEEKQAGGNSSYLN